MQVAKGLRKQLARALAAGSRGVAFAELYGVDDRPRADDLENMIRTFPGLDRVDWSAEPVESGLNVDLWQSWLAKHCGECGELEVNDRCYFKLVHHFLKSGFEPTVREGCDVKSAVPTCRAYVYQWKKEEDDSDRAFAKWVREAVDLMSPPTEVVPPTFYPLLPVVREKDRWIFENEGVRYKVRLCMDPKNGDLNDMFEDWPFQYCGLDNIPQKVKKGDWLAALDISRFYLRLPAGRKLRNLLWFQDPSSYAKDSRGNEQRSSSNLRFRQLLVAAFGLKPAPAYASVVSAELARILESFGSLRLRSGQLRANNA